MTDWLVERGLLDCLGAAAWLLLFLARLDERFKGSAVDLLHLDEHVVRRIQYLLEEYDVFVL